MLEMTLFSIAPSDDLEFFLESSDGVIENSTRPSKLHYGVDNILLGSIETSQGRIEDGINQLLFESVPLEVDMLGGYQSDPFEDDIFDFSVKTPVNKAESAVDCSFISCGFNYCIQLKFLKGFTQVDIMEIKHVIVDGTYKNYEGKAHFGDVL